MKTLSTARSLAYFLDELWFTEAALHADPDAADLAPDFDAAIDRWESVAQRERAARRGIVRAEAVVSVRDAQLDGTTTRFAGVVLVEAANDRRSSFYRRFFSEAPSTFVTRNLRDQSEQTRDRIVPEILKLSENSLLRRFADPLAAQAKAALQALTSRTKARGENATVVSDVTDWKESVNRLRTTTYAELLKRSAERNLGREWPETFFRRDESSAAVDDEPAPAPTPEPQPA